MYCGYDVLSRKDTTYRTFYGETILTMIDRSKKTPIALTTCFYSDKFNLKRRIIGIMDHRLPKKFLSASFLVAVPLLLLLTSSVFALENPVAQHKSLRKRKDLETVLKELSLAEKDVKDVQISREKGNYKILFAHGQTAHEMLVNAKTGKVVQSKQHTIVEKTVTVEKEVPPSSSSAATPADSGSGNAGQTGSVSSPTPATNTVTNSNTNTSTAPVQPSAQTSTSKSKDKDRDDDKDDDDDDDDDD